MFSAIKTVKTVISFYLLAFVLPGSGGAHATAAEAADQTGFLVVAADRGFVGNEEIRDAFESFATHHPAALVFVTDERTRQTLQSALASLQNHDINRIVVLPLFISTAEPRYQLVHKLITKENQAVPAVFSPPYGESYFAVEALASRLRAMEPATRQHLLVVGYGAQDDTSRRAMHNDWIRITRQASQGMNFRSTSPLILLEKKEDEASENYSNAIKQQLARAFSPAKSAAKNSGNRVIAFALGPKHDNMMSLEARLEWLLPKNAILDHFQIGPQHLTMWMEREANRNLPLTAENTGVILFAHGSDFHWNENLRTAVQPLMNRYKIEFAFSMADPLTIERALRKLEQRGAKAAVIVSAYATKNSFRKEITRMVGMDIEAHQADQHTAHGHAQDGHGASSAAPRILTSLPVIWTGGYEDSPLFAKALLDRALALSRDPSKETIILTAHGMHDDQRNNEWLQNLESIAQQMHNNGGENFRAFKVATWREDWPEKRAPWVKKIRAMITEAGQQGDTAIVIPARTTATGPEKKFLSDLKFKLGEGFAPHPLFTQWVDEQIQQGLKLHADALVRQEISEK
ncbi:cobalamin biosynthesis protein CbiX [Nitrosomonas sp. HPC101]|uniref:sirohydrochlorin chelatase n=1 Tax=Nitrosomonas sp. HPC101 TaxID=1658667 RepID=UPI00136CC7E1|nr:CbiX/SirB N-terminal domain-containing protein [Nitrosomonas sp. HPC101]MXS85888.1 cobalamin biosynthesis protein CbiX [Nitrosomonas sp. HPC101]